MKEPINIENVPQRGRPKDPNARLNAYDPKIGETLLSYAEEPGHPLCRLRADFNLYHDEMDGWALWVKDAIVTSILSAAITSLWTDDVITLINWLR